MNDANVPATPSPESIALKEEEKAARDHELQTFLRQDLAEIASEYKRIYSRATEDPGTAGDEGEENWKALLSQWLPDTYKLVTKGRVLGVNGTASPQVDLLVLQAGYPARLLNKKVYLIDGVVAAFECKTTLKAAHLSEAALTAKAIRALATPRTGSPYRELFRPPIYGVLAHSHAWKSAASTPLEHIDRRLAEAHLAADHPRDLVNLVCVADLACWQLGALSYLGKIYFDAKWPEMREHFQLPDEGGPQTTYSRWHESDTTRQPPNPVAVLVANLFQEIAWQDPSLRTLANYFQLAGLTGPSQGTLRPWPLHAVYSPQVADRLQTGAAVNGVRWDEWGIHLP